MCSDEADYAAGSRCGKGYSKGSKTTDWWGPGDVLVVNGRAVYQSIKPRGHLAELLQAPLRGTVLVSCSPDFGLEHSSPPNLKAEMCDWSGSSPTVVSVRGEKLACRVSRHPIQTHVLRAFGASAGRIVQGAQPAHIG